MQLLDHAIKIAKKAGKLTEKIAKKNIKIEHKSINDLVTNADKASEELIIKEIKKLYPDHGFIGEESHYESGELASDLAQAPYIWIVDPIDGTTNYAHKNPYYAISIGVFKNTAAKSSKNYQYLEGEMVAGVIHAPALKETFYASKGNGAYLNGKKIQVSEITKMENSVTITGFPYKNKTDYLCYFEAMMGKTQGIRRLGAAALDMAYLACGRYDIFWEFSLKAWDIAAGAIIIEEAGGKVTDINGNLVDLFGEEILASNGLVHEEAKRVLEKVDGPR